MDLRQAEADSEDLILLEPDSEGKKLTQKLSRDAIFIFRVGGDSIDVLGTKLGTILGRVQERIPLSCPVVSSECQLSTTKIVPRFVLQN